MGKESEKNPRPDYFKTLFGNIAKGGLGLFLNNPFQRKPESDSQQAIDVGVGGTFEQGVIKHEKKRGQSLEAKAREAKDDEYNKHLGQVRQKTEAVNEARENSGQGNRKTKVNKDIDEDLQHGIKKIKSDSVNNVELDPRKNKKKADSGSNENVVPGQNSDKVDSEIQEARIHKDDSSGKTKKKQNEEKSCEERSAAEEILGSLDEKKANSSNNIEAEECKKDSIQKERKRKDDATGEIVQTKEEKKKKQDATEDFVQTKEEKKRKQDATEGFVQTKEEKKRKVLLAEDQTSREAQADEVQEVPGRRLGKRIIEEEDINVPNKKRKVSNLRLHDFERGLGKSEIANSAEQADPKSKSELGKRKRDVVEEEYAVRHGLQIDETPSKEGLISKKTLGKRKRGADEEDMVVKKEAFDDGDKLHRTIFVGNLPLSLKRKQLIKEFSQFGEVESVRLRSVPILDSKLPRKNAILKGQIDDSHNSVNGYVVFKEEQSANAALTHNLAELDGNHIRVDRAYPPSKKLKGENHCTYDYKRTVFVGNLPFDVKDEELYQLFIATKDLESSVEAIRVIRDPHTSKGKGIAYVLFKTMNAAKLAIKKNQFKLRDRGLRLSKARPDSQQGSQAVSTPGSWSDMNPRTDGLSVKRPAESAKLGLPNLLAKKKSKISLSYQGTKASKTDGRPVKLTGATSMYKDKKSDSVHANGPKPRQSKRPAVASRKASLSKSPGSNHAGKKRKQVEARTGYSKSPKKFKTESAD